MSNVEVVSRIAAVDSTAQCETSIRFPHPGSVHARSAWASIPLDCYLIFLANAELRTPLLYGASGYLRALEQS